MQEVWATLDREEVVALGLFVAVTMLAALCFPWHVPKTEVETELPLWGWSSPSADSVLGAGGELQGVGSCSHSDLNRQGLTVLLFSCTGPQKEVCPQRPL